MVEFGWGLLAATELLVATETAQKPPILTMPGGTRARVLAVLAGLVILGFAMMALAWLGARLTRRYMNRGNRQGVRLDSNPNEDDWVRPIVDPPGGADTKNRDATNPENSDDDPRRD